MTNCDTSLVLNLIEKAGYSAEEARLIRTFLTEGRLNWRSLTLQTILLSIPEVKKAMLARAMELKKEKERME